MSWWLWIVVGLALLALEVLTPGIFVAGFFAAAAVLVGALTGVGLLDAVWMQWTLFGVVSVAALGLLRGRLQRGSAADAGHEVDSLVGQWAVTLDDLPPGAVGKAELRGTSWSVQNIGQTGLVRGERCRIERVDGLQLLINGDRGRIS